MAEEKLYIKKLLRQAVAYETGTLPHEEFLPFLQELIDTGTLKAMPIAYKYITRKLIATGDLRPAPPENEES